MHGSVNADTPDRQVDDLLHPRPRIIEQREQDRVASSLLESQVRHGQDRGEVVWREVVDRFASPPLHGDGEDLLTLHDAFGLFDLQVTEEGMDGRQPLVAGARGDAALLQMAEECPDKFHIEAVEGQMFGGDSALVPGVAKKQGEGIAVSLDGVGSGVALVGEMLAEETRQVCGEIGWFHGCVSLGMA